MENDEIKSESEYSRSDKKPRLDLVPVKSVNKINESSSESSTIQHRRKGVTFRALDAYKRHKMLINHYSLTYPGAVSKTLSRDTSKDCSDYQVLLDNHRFIWDDDVDQGGDDEDGGNSGLTWGQRVAKKYYDKLFKEYCIVDLSRYREKKFGMRWRTEPEVIDGKGQFVCGAKRCSEGRHLTSWEVLFSYLEGGQKKQALVKLRLCEDCSKKLNYHHKHKKAKLAKRKARKLRKKRKYSSNDDIPQEEEEQQQQGEVSTTKNHITIKEEEDSETEEIEITENQDLIDEIWRRPVKLEPDEQENNLNDEVDDYLSQMFL